VSSDWGVETIERSKAGEMRAAFDLRRLGQSLDVPIPARIDSPDALKAVAERVEVALQEKRERVDALLEREDDDDSVEAAADRTLVSEAAAAVPGARRTIERAKRGDMGAIDDLRRLAKSLGIELPWRIKTPDALKAQAHAVEVALRKRASAMLTREAPAGGAQEDGDPTTFTLHAGERSVHLAGRPVQVRVVDGRLQGVALDGAVLDARAGLQALAVYCVWKRTLRVSDVERMRAGGFELP
jgi:hypothetical protein